MLGYKFCIYFWLACSEFSVKTLKLWRIIIIAMSVHNKSMKVWNSCVVQINQMSMTSIDSNCCDSYCFAQVFPNLPAPPKHYGTLDVLDHFQSFFGLEDLGPHLAMSHDDTFLLQGKQILAKNFPSACPCWRFILWWRKKPGRSVKTAKLSNNILHQLLMWYALALLTQELSSTLL